MYFLYERCAGNKEVCFPFRLIKNKVETDSILLSLVSKEDDSSWAKSELNRQVVI